MNKFKSLSPFLSLPNISKNNVYVYESSYKSTMGVEKVVSYSFYNLTVNYYFN